MHEFNNLNNLNLITFSTDLKLNPQIRHIISTTRDTVIEFYNVQYSHRQTIVHFIIIKYFF